MKINWKQKLSSRKLWAAVAAFLYTLFGVIFKDSLTPEQCDLVLYGICALCVYVFGESGIDMIRIAKRNADEIRAFEEDEAFEDDTDVGRRENEEETDIIFEGRAKNAACGKKSETSDPADDEESGKIIIV